MWLVCLDDKNTYLAPRTWAAIEGASATNANNSQSDKVTWCAPTAAEDILVATAVATAQQAISDVVLTSATFHQKKVYSSGRYRDMGDDCYVTVPLRQLKRNKGRGENGYSCIHVSPQIGLGLLVTSLN